MRGIATIVMFLLLWAQPLLAGVFSDVPPGHPARAAIETLFAKGIIKGVDQQTFAGDRSISRYELALSFFRILARLEEPITADCVALSDQDISNIDYLKNNFSEELFLLGLRVEIAQNRKEQLREEIDLLRARVKNAETSIRKASTEVKVAGDWLVRHTAKTHRDDHAVNAFSGSSRPGNSNNTLTESQIRLSFKSRLSDDISVFSRFRLFDRGDTSFSAPQSVRGGAYGLNGIGNVSNGDLVVDNAYIEIKKALGSREDLVLGRITSQSGHGLLLNADFDVLRFSRESSRSSAHVQYIYDRHKGVYKDAADVDFRGVFNAGYRRSLRSGNFYANIFAQDSPNLVNRRIPGTFTPGTAPGEQKNDQRRDFETGCTLKFGKSACLTADLAVALTDYRAKIAKPAAGNMLDVDLRGMAGHAALDWQPGGPFSLKLAWNFANDEFAGAYALDLDRRYSDAAEAPYEDIARGNNWFRYGLQNMSDLKLQADYNPRGRHSFRVTADFLREVKDQVYNDLSHHLAGNSDGAIPVGFVAANSPYDTFNNIGVANPEMQILSCEYRYRLQKNTSLRVGYVRCDFSGEAFRRSVTPVSIPSGRGFRGDYDYNMLWLEVYSRF
ncbi:MAG: S-layer homology domain-containing protein [Candidatus Riflebacteria bacterium]|nr:S-layer homology domain-containing protein [Candidatus Riflebacteria bacterium]